MNICQKMAVHHERYTVDPYQLEDGRRELLVNKFRVFRINEFPRYLHMSPREPGQQYQKIHLEVRSLLRA